MWFPEPPDVPAELRAQGSVFLRYEDVAQDGSLKVGAIPVATGAVCFRDIWLPHPINLQTRPQGILPILSRMVMRSTGRPIAVRNPVEIDGRVELAHVRDERGAVSRLVLNTHCELYAEVGRTHDPQPPNRGERIHVGSVFSEHVFTRPFAPPEQRKVLALPLTSGPYVPPVEVPLREPTRTLALPEGATWLEADYVLDAVPLAFGTTHTDSNQHVNSLVYPQLFEHAALRRLLDLGHSVAALLVDHIEIAFRKPCFAGERAWLYLRAFELGNKLGALGYLGGKDTSPERAHCLCALTFDARS